MDIGSIISNLEYNPLQRPGQASANSSKPSIEEMAQRLIEAKDKDHSGTLGATELCISQELFDRIDANGANTIVISTALLQNCGAINRGAETCKAIR